MLQHWENKMTTDIEHTTFADYETVKGTITNLYFITVRTLGEYFMKSDFVRERTARESLIKLSLALNKKSYVLRDKEAVDYLAYFMINPHEFGLMDLQTVFLICQNICERLGITKIEQAQVPKHKAYLEDGNY